MPLARNNAPLMLGPAVPTGTPRRFGRVRCERLNCRLGTGVEGTVIDLSAGGARLLFRHKPGVKVGESGEVVVESETVAGLSLTMRVVWMKKRGFRRHEVGISFGEPPAPVRASLGQIMRTATVTNTVYRESVE